MHKLSARDVAWVGVMASLAIALSFLESLLPQMPFLPPGAKLGLSNLVVLYAAAVTTLPRTLMIAMVKSMFVFFMRGPVAGTLSLTGGLLSALVMVSAMRAIKVRFSYLFVSVLGAVTHNLGQLLAASLMIGSAAAWGYLPYVLIAGVAMGAINGWVVRTIMPALRRLSRTSPPARGKNPQ